MTTYPLATLAPTIDATGISAPSFDDCFLSLCASFRSIYGQDVVLTSDTQDGQWLGTLAQAVSDCNSAAVAIFNSFAPSYARGAPLASLVKINGLTKVAATYSTCDVLIVGTAGAPITNGVIQDKSGYLWSLPASVTIPPSASVTVTATCQTAGAISATVDAAQIATPTQGWLTATIVDTSIGVADETDSTLRQRQSSSTAISAKSPMETIASAVGNLPGVSRVTYDENTTSSTNANGTPAHGFALVVEGGDATEIAQTIADTKGEGSGTFGSVSVLVTDAFGIPATISFSRPTYERSIVAVSVKPLPGWTIEIGNTVVAAIAAYINTLPMGENIYLTQVIAMAIQNSGGIGTFNLTSLTMCIYGGTLAAADTPIAYNQAATCVVGDVSLSIVS